MVNGAREAYVRRHHAIRSMGFLYPRAAVPANLKTASSMNGRNGRSAVLLAMVERRREADGSLIMPRTGACRVRAHSKRFSSVLDKNVAAHSPRIASSAIGRSGGHVANAAGSEKGSAASGSIRLREETSVSSPPQRRQESVPAAATNRTSVAGQTGVLGAPVLLRVAKAIDNGGGNSTYLTAHTLCWWREMSSGSMMTLYSAQRSWMHAIFGSLPLRSLLAVCASWHFFSLLEVGHLVVRGP
mmetsp:Transcript_23354/g.54097  ORF Transcript_23354/g.54097 Transcript_23354/m.54097 type:complete len:243 (+) Transcript_23354:3920-4648(+)